MKHEHRECDTFFAEAEEAVAKDDWETASEKFLAFANETILHFKKEEEELFPAFESHTSITQGPTQIMRYKHEQLKQRQRCLPLFSRVNDDTPSAAQHEKRAIALRKVRQTTASKITRRSA